MKRFLILFCLGTVAISGSRFLLAADSHSDLKREHMEWIDSVLREVNTIKPGMTREDLSKVFTMEGGLSNRVWRRYVLKECPYIKVDVTFDPVGEEQNQLTQKNEDRIKSISKPFLEYPIMD